MNYDTNLKHKWDNENVLEYAVQQAREDERKKTELDTARKMKEKGYPLKDIIDFTGLTLKEIESI